MMAMVGAVCAEWLVGGPDVDGPRVRGGWVSGQGAECSGLAPKQQA